jgi:hypothetical protein
MVLDAGDDYAGCIFLDGVAPCDDDQGRATRQKGLLKRTPQKHARPRDRKKQRWIEMAEMAMMTTASTTTKRWQELSSCVLTNRGTLDDPRSRLTA